jgi:hypothetical protein
MYDDLGNQNLIVVLFNYNTRNHGQATGNLYHLQLRVECTHFCNLQNRAWTHAVLVIGLYELLGNLPATNHWHIENVITEKN